MNQRRSEDSPPDSAQFIRRHQSYNTPSLLAMVRALVTRTAVPAIPGIHLLDSLVFRPGHVHFKKAQFHILSRH